MNKITFTCISFVWISSHTILFYIYFIFLSLIPPTLHTRTRLFYTRLWQSRLNLHSNSLLSFHQYSDTQHRLESCLLMLRQNKHKNIKVQSLTILKKQSIIPTAKLWGSLKQFCHKMNGQLCPLEKNNSNFRRIVWQTSIHKIVVSRWYVSKFETVWFELMRKLLIP